MPPRAIELGINFFDTYPDECEGRWCEALSGGKRVQVYLQVKIEAGRMVDLPLQPRA